MEDNVLITAKDASARKYDSVVRPILRLRRRFFCRL
jgi:hypothetical protein